MKELQFDMRCKAICQDFDRECEFLQGTYNGTAFNMALPNEYYLDSLLEVYAKQLPRHVGVNELHLGPLGVILYNYT